MADRSLAIRLAVVDGGKVKAELRDVGDAGSRSLKRIEDAARPASRALQALDGVAGEVRGNLESMAGRLGPLGAGLSRIGPAGLAAAAALAGVGLALTRSFQEAAEADRSYRRLEAVLKATGHASGLTAGEISTFAEAMEASTLVTAEAVQDAASVLATFRSVSGETFTRALALAQDLATVFGSDLSSAATQLGKALEDPAQGLTALRRVGISFTESEKELITSLAETGRTAEAQRLILDALEKQVGGASVAEAGGLTGATNRLGDAWGNLLESIGRTPVIASVAQGASTGIKTRAQAEAIIAFFRARGGRAQGFRFKDWSDYRASGQVLGTGDEARTTFQLVKRYVSGAEEDLRLISKPVAGSVKVYLNGTPQASGWSVDTATGLVTFTSAPAAGAVITADFEFDVPVRFDTDRLEFRLETHDLMVWEQIPIIEVRL